MIFKAPLYQRGMLILVPKVVKVVEVYLNRQSTIKLKVTPNVSSQCVHWGTAVTNHSDLTGHWLVTDAPEYLILLTGCLLFLHI